MEPSALGRATAQLFTDIKNAMHFETDMDDLFEWCGAWLRYGHRQHSILDAAPTEQDYVYNKLIAARDLYLISLKPEPEPTPVAPIKPVNLKLEIGFARELLRVTRENLLAHAIRLQYDHKELERAARLRELLEQLERVNIDLIYVAGWGEE
jgi:hypothetical protein